MTMHNMNNFGLVRASDGHLSILSGWAFRNEEFFK